jgi:hypothetical protein
MDRVGVHSGFGSFRTPPALDAPSYPSLFFWQPVQCLATALEIWLALCFLDAGVSFIEAMVIESLIQTVSSVGFFVPCGLDVQEGGLVLIGGALGLDPAICLPLAGARRIRDLLIFVPGLFAWQIAESAGKTRHGGVSALAGVAARTPIDPERACQIAARSPRSGRRLRGRCAEVTAPSQRGLAIWLVTRAMRRSDARRPRMSGGHRKREASSRSTVLSPPAVPLHPASYQACRLAIACVTRRAVRAVCFSRCHCDWRAAGARDPGVSFVWFRSSQAPSWVKTLTE